MYSVDTLNHIMVTVSDKVLGIAARFWRLVCDLNQMSSVVCGCISSRLDEHYRWITATHCCRRFMVESTSAFNVDAITWVSTASWVGGCGSGPRYIRWTSKDIIQILRGCCCTHCMDQLTVHLCRKFVIVDRGTIGTSLTPRLRQQGACPVFASGSGGRQYQTPCWGLKDNSADVTRVYRPDDLVLHRDNGSLCWVARSIRWLAIRKKSLWLDMTSEADCCSLLDNLWPKREIRYWPISTEVVRV